MVLGMRVDRREWISICTQYHHVVGRRDKILTGQLLGAYMVGTVCWLTYVLVAQKVGLDPRRPSEVKIFWRRTHGDDKGTAGYFT